MIKLNRKNEKKMSFFEMLYFIDQIVKFEQINVFDDFNIT